MIKNFLLGFLIFGFLSCDFPDKPRDEIITDDPMPAAHKRLSKLSKLCQYWEITDAEHPLTKDIFNYGDTAGIYNYPGIVFLNDSLIIENPKGEVRFGKFTIAGDKINARFMDGGEASYFIIRLEEKTLHLGRIEKGKKTFLECSSDGFNYADSNNNPYDPILNQWRLKPKMPEDSEALRTRLKQYVLFYVNFFNDALKKETRDMDFLGLPCCFTWYKGGIYIQNEKSLDRKFMNCFYNDAQALKARQMLEDVLKKKFTWVKGEDNWIKQTAPVLQQIRDSI